MAANKRFQNKTSRIPLEEVKKMWESRQPIGVIMQATGLTRKPINDLAKEHGWVREPRRRKNDYVPTPEEIAAAIAATQANWSAEDFERHWQGEKRKPVAAQCLRYDTNAGAFVA